MLILIIGFFLCRRDTTNNQRLKPALVFEHHLYGPT